MEERNGERGERKEEGASICKMKTWAQVPRSLIEGKESLEGWRWLSGKHWGPQQRGPRVAVR